METKMISNKNIRKVLEKERLKTKSILVTDKNMKLVTPKILKKIRRWNLVRFCKYRTETFDCDEFAYVCQGMARGMYGNIAFGIAIVSNSVGRHAMNCFIDENKELVLFEPQNNLVKNRSVYTIEQVIM